MSGLTRAIVSAAAIVAVATTATTAGKAEGYEAGAVKVTIKYTGKGPVDASHRVWVWLFDTPEIGPGAMPVAEDSVGENGGTATFATVDAKQVWIAVAYDAQGGFAGQSPPPSGAPVAFYGMPPTAVEPGDKGAVTVTFDDSQRMP